MRHSTCLEICGGDGLTWAQSAWLVSAFRFLKPGDNVQHRCSNQSYNKCNNCQEGSEVDALQG